MQAFCCLAAASRGLGAAAAYLLRGRCGPPKPSHEPPCWLRPGLREASLCVEWLRAEGAAHRERTCRASQLPSAGVASEAPPAPRVCPRSKRPSLPPATACATAGRSWTTPPGSVLLPPSCLSAAASSCLPGPSRADPLSLYFSRQSVRFKMVKSSAYRRRSRASPTGQSQKAHVGPRRLSAEYVTPGAVLVKQRRYIAWGFETKRRRRHAKMYPGENVGVAKDSSLVALVHGRVKFTHDVTRNVLLCNVLPEPREELLREDLWRYRTEHVGSKEENRQVCHLRRKATRVFPKQLVNPPTKPLPRPKWLSRFDHWQNPTLPDAPPLAEDRQTHSASHTEASHARWEEAAAVSPARLSLPLLHAAAAAPRAASNAHWGRTATEEAFSSALHAN
ncbi:hypothetical protein Efla_005492 [Eimeria flavescens]